MKKMISILKDFLYELAGAFIYSIGIQCFINPAQIAPGGMSGVSIMINHLTGFPIGTTSFLLNIPILFFGFRHLSRRLMYKTLFTLVLATIILDYIAAPYFPVYVGNQLLGAVFGGLLMGTGLGIVFLRGATTGGTDVLSYLVQKRYPHIPIGKAILFIDCIILSASIFVFHNIETALYGLISLFCCTRIIDTIIYGTESGNMILIISDQYEEISKAIMHRIERGVTLLSSKGGYTGKNRPIILCALRRTEFAAVKRLTYSIDEKAFIIVSKADNIIGHGFQFNVPAP